MCFKGIDFICFIRGVIILSISTFSLKGYCQSGGGYVDRLGDSRGGSYAININIFNRYDDHLIDTTYMGNSEMFRMLDSLMRDTTIINYTRRINVLSSSSIEGSVPYNTALSIRRMNKIEETLRSRYHFIDADMWSFDSTPENWEHLRGAVVEDRAVPNQEGVISIVDMTHIHPDTREQMLKDFKGGESWSYIHRNILPASRGSVSLLLVPWMSGVVGDVNRVWDSYYNWMCDPFGDIRGYVDPPRRGGCEEYQRPLFSVRSNLLLDATSTLNIGVEFPLAPRWSVSAEYVNPWWKRWDRDLTWQIQSLYFDLRYWFSPRERYNTLTGWSAGLYVGSGCYDLQPFSYRGVQGEYTDLGATISYAHRLGGSKHWLMEYNFGLGYVTTHYRHYYTADETSEFGNIKVHYYPWSEETLRAAIPTRVGVTLCYLVNIVGLKCGRASYDY